MSRDDDDLFDALRAGASGYLLKDMDAARLGSALEGVLAGEGRAPALSDRSADRGVPRPRHAGDCRSPANAGLDLDSAGVEPD